MTQATEDQRPCLHVKTQLTRRKRNREAVQQAVLVALLSLRYDVEIEKPAKKTNVTSQIPKVKSISVGGETLDYDTFVRNRFTSDLQHDSADPASYSKARRQFNHDTKVFTNNYLLDLCRESGIVFNSHLSRASKNTQRIEYFYEVFQDRRMILSSDDIEVCGTRLCAYFADAISHNHVFTVRRSDHTVCQILEAGAAAGWVTGSEENWGM